MYTKKENNAIPLFTTQTQLYLMSIDQYTDASVVRLLMDFTYFMNNYELLFIVCVYFIVFSQN